MRLWRGFAVGLLCCLAISSTLAFPAVASAQDGWECGAFDQTGKRNRTPVADGSGRVFPVVTIHGITGSDDDFDRTIDKSYIGANPQPPRSLLDAFAGSKSGATLPPGLEGVHVYSFSYTPDSLRWVDNPAVGGKFAATIDCLYAKFGVPVSVVAHSMGGLVTRWVANSTDGAGVARATKLGKVVTLGTPYEGSLMSAFANGATDVAGAATPIVSVLNLLCGASGTSSGTGSCGPIPLYASFRSEGGRNLRVGSPAISDLDRWPAGPEVTTIAGSQRVPFRLFGSPLKTVADLGDLAVTTESATADPVAGRVFECSYDTATGTALTAWKAIFGLASPQERRARLTGAFLASPCYHSNLMQNVELTNEVLGQLSDRISARRSSPPVTDEELRSLSLPGEICGGLELAPGEHRLSGGEYVEERDLATERSITVGGTDTGDLDGDGIADGAVTLGCMNGIADHIDILRVVLADGRRQFDVALTVERPELEPFDPAVESLVDIDSITIEDGALEARMLWSFMNDPTCCPTTVANGSYRWSGGAFERTDVVVIDERARTQRLVDALNTSDTAAIASLLEPGFETWLTDAVPRGVTFGRREWVLPDILDSFRYCEITHSEGDYPYAVRWDGGRGPDLPGEEPARATPILGD